MAKKILSSDILIVDNMIPLSYKSKEEIKRLEAKDPTLTGQYMDVESLPEPRRTQYMKLNALLEDMLKKKGVEWGQKIAINKEEFVALSEAITHIPTNGMEAGGSSANTLTTLSRLLGDENIHVDFLGVTGGGMYSNMIRGDLEKAHIRIVPEKLHLPEGQSPQSAVSFVFTEPGGKRTIATYPGNARAILKPEMITDDLVAKNDVVFVQGSLWEKFDRSLPDTFLAKRWKQNKEIWLALPTHAKFSDQMQPDNYRFLIPSADVLLGNSEELMRIYETKNLDDAVKRLQSDLGKRDDIRAREGLPPRKREATAFISNGGDGAIAITPTRIERVDAIPLHEKGNYFLGAGDTSYAGFLAGHIAGLSLKESAEMAMELASAKIKYNSARIPDPGPAHEMEKGNYRSKRLWEKVQANLNQHQMA
jgi:sugar/nucleoside kinase (ribokinase family)